MNREEIMFQINQDLAQAILNYLVSRPYAEVYHLVAALQQIEKAGEAVKEDTSVD